MKLFFCVIMYGQTYIRMSGLAENWFLLEELWEVPWKILSKVSSMGT